MADLSTYHIRLKDRPKKGIIDKASKHESRLRLHTETHLDTSDLAGPVTDFLNWVSGLIAKDKFTIFKFLFRLPSPVLQLTKEIYTELSRVFDSKNASEQWTFTDMELADDWSDYRQNVLDDPSVWRGAGWEIMKTRINSVVVVDLPQDQGAGIFAEPYFYFLSIDKVVDYEMNRDGSLRHIIFDQTKPTKRNKKQEFYEYAIFDDTHLRRVRVSATDRRIIDILLDVPHDLGYCPASFFWREPMTLKHPDIKAAPISPEIANLDWLLFFSIGKRQLDLYAPYPIYSAYEVECDYEDLIHGRHCDKGFLRGSDDRYLMDSSGTLTRCPVCSDKRLAGPGTFVEIPAPEAKDDADLREPVTITPIDRDSLDYNVDEVERLEKRVKESVVGKGGMADSKEALNVQHVLSNFDAKTTVLRGLKENIQFIRKWTLDTCAKFRYGGAFINSSLNMGTEFYLATVKDLHELYDTAKKNGASIFELDAIRDQIIATEYRHDPVLRNRLLILSHLEPYSHNTREELIELKNQSLTEDRLLILKTDFATFVAQFERENTDVVTFGSLLPLNDKIKIIQETLLEYADTRRISSPEGAE